MSNPLFVGIGSPFRAPCGGWPTPIYGTMGSRDQHCNSADDGKAVETNVTKHAGSPIAPSGGGIPSTDACAGGDTTVSLGGDGSQWNCYHTAGTTANYSLCRKIGVKNLCAAKAWQGVNPFSGTNSDQCSGVIAATTNQTRYLTRNATITETVSIPYCVNPAGSGTVGYHTTVYTATQQYTMNRWSGVATQDACSDSDGARTAASTGCLSMDYQCGQWSGPGGTYAETLASILNGAGGAAAMSQSVPGSGASATSVSFSLTINSTTPGTCGVDGSGNPIALPPTTNTYAVTITLGNPYTSDDLYSDVCGMLSAQASNFADDAVYPWRLDGSCFLAPLLTVDEAISGDLVATRTCGWTDSATNTGNVIGGFVPAGYARFFNPNAKVFTDPSTWTGQYGQSAPDWCPNAKQWMDLSQGQWGTPGYWASYHWGEAGLGGAVLFDGKMIVNIWAETIMFVVPSFNFARPCGADDQAAIDQPTATCTGGTLSGTHRWTGVPSICPTNPTTGYQWFDTGAKGQFISKHWTFDARDIQVTPGLRTVTNELKSITVAQQCISHTPCCPNVAYIAPFTIPFSNAVQISPSSPGVDDIYGTMDRWRVEQWMTDPCYQPPKQCPTGGSWNEDDGSCTGDYPLEPYVEPILAVPSGAPALPSGCAFPDYAGYISGRNSGTIASVDYRMDSPVIGQCGGPAPGYARWITRRLQESHCCGIPADECDDYIP